MELTTKQKLSALQNEIFKLNQKHDMFLNFSNLKNSAFVTATGYKSQIQEQQYKNDLFKFVVNLFKCNKFPEIISDKKYEMLPPAHLNYLGININNTEFYRGSKSIYHHANLLCDEIYHLGVGDVCSGLYVATLYSTALTYADSKPENVLKLKAPKLNIIDDLSLSIAFSDALIGENINFVENKPVLEEIANYINSIKDIRTKSEMIFHLNNDPSLIAIFLGYDAIYDHNFPSYAILNRGKICVSESEYNRVCELSKRPLLNNNQPH